MTITPQQLRSLLQQQRDTTHKLLQILAEEHAALSGNDLQDLETILAAKQQFMAQLEASSQEYLELSGRLSASPKTGITILLKQCDPQGAWGLEPLWRQVEKLLSQCRQKNNVNGKIITLSHRHIQRALEILRHGELGAEPCYSPTGTRPSAAFSRTLGKG